MAAYPPGAPPVPPPMPPPGYDPRAYRRVMRDQMRAQRDAIRAQRQRIRYQMRSMRRGSILGPILLIAVGVLFLLFETGRFDRQLFWDRFGRWWPLLLLFAGVILLAEWAFDQNRLRDPNQPRYRRSVGGSAVLLLVIFVIVGILATEGFRFRSPPDTLVIHGFTISPDSLDELFGDKHESDQTLDLPLSASGALALVNPRGDVTLSGTSDDNRIHLAIHKQVYARDDSDADSKAQQLTPADNFDGSALTMPSLDGARADLVLTVPAGTAITVTANRGDIHISSIKAPVFATANHGDIDLSAITGQASAHINSSSNSVSARSMGSGLTIEGRGDNLTLTDISGPVSISGDFFGSTHLQHIAAPVRFHTSRTDFQLARLDGEADFDLRTGNRGGPSFSADQVLGPVVIATSNHDISLDRVAGDISITDKNGAIDLTAAEPLGNITLADRNGSIKTVVPQHAGLFLQADTTNGNIETDLPISTTSTRGDFSNGSDDPRKDSHRTLSGRVGAGGPLLHLTTANGDVSLNSGTVLPLSLTLPAPPKLTLTPPASAHPAKTHK